MILFCIGLFVSYVYSLLILPGNEGSEPTINPTIYPLLYKGMIIIPYSDVNAIHLHHWVVYFFICLLSLFVDIPRIIVGFSSGLFLQGIQYKDSFHFICSNPYNYSIEQNLNRINVN